MPKSAFEHARRKARKPLQLKRVDGKFKVDGPMYGGLVAGAMRLDGVDVMVLAQNINDLEAVWTSLGMDADDVRVNGKKVAIAQSNKVRRA